MSNVWLKSKAVVCVLTFVFLFTSVFTTTISFAETVQADESATVEEPEKDADKINNEPEFSMKCVLIHR